MKKLSSDFLYYKGLTGYIVGPALVILFVKFIMVNNVPDLLKDIIYCLLIIVIITQGRLIYKTRQVVYNSTNIILTTYFTKKSENIQITKVVSLKKAFSLQRKANRKLYKLTYLRENEVYSIYFFKALALSYVDDLERVIGVKDSGKFKESEPL